MIHSQILKLQLYFLLSFEFFLLSQTIIYLIQLICWVSFEHTFSFLLIVLPSLLFLLPFIVQTLYVTHFKYYCEDLGWVLSLL